MDHQTFQKIKAAVDLAIDHVVEKGFDDIFKPPIFVEPLEHLSIKEATAEFRAEAWAATLKFLKVADLSIERIGNIHHYMVPKDEVSFRRIAWMDPFDCVKYLSVCILLFKDIENMRAPKSEGIIHSHRMSNEAGKLFDENYGYNSFRQRSGEISKEKSGKWKITTDISNFFERIGNHPLENHLRDAGCEEKYVKLVREILFQWAGDRRSFGIPVGSDASRILCEAALIGVDRKLQAKNIKYVRYVDDFRLFAENRSEAHEIVRVLSEFLIEEGLSINPKKTFIGQIIDGKEIAEQAVEILQSTHSAINLSEKSVIAKAIVVSGKSSLSRFYREPGKEAVAALAKIDIKQHVEKISRTTNSEQEIIIRECVKHFIYVNQDVDTIFSVAKLKITSIFYIVDALIKDADRIDDDNKKLIKENISKVMEFSDLSYPFRIPLLRLAAHRGYEDPSLIDQIIDEHRMSDSYTFFREALFLSRHQINRYKIRDLVMQVFPVAPALVQRSIYSLVQSSKKMGDEEKRPLLRNMQQVTGDYFIKRLKAI